MKNRKKHISLLLAVACAFSVSVGSFAFFTDRIDTTVTATAGTLDVNLNDFSAKVTPTDVANSILKPGRAISIGYNLANDGSKSADILETIVVTMTPKDSSTVINATTPEFALYNASDVTIDSNTGLATVDPTKALSTVSADGKQVTYAIPEYILSGKEGSSGREVEGTAPDDQTQAFCLVFSSGASNAFQGASLTLDYEAQAKQHRNTTTATWATVKSETITFAGDGSYAAVPALP